MERVVAGKTGTGKSAFICQLLKHLRRPTVRAVIIDKGQNVPPGSYLTLAPALGGAELRFDVGGGTFVNPFDITPEHMWYFLGDETSPDDTQYAAQKHTFLVTLIDWLVSPHGNAGLSRDELARVGEAISQTYRRGHPAAGDSHTTTSVYATRSEAHERGVKPAKDLRGGRKCPDDLRPPCAQQPDGIQVAVDCPWLVPLTNIVTV